MIVFDLTCDHDHVFEAWFPDSAAFERQSREGALACPVCSSSKVHKAPMAPNIASGRDGEDTRTDQGRKFVEAMKALRKMRDHVEKNSEDVGPRFAEEARKIHYGETEKRNIRGDAKPAEARELHEEGVPFTVIPWLPRGDS